MPTRTTHIAIIPGLIFFDELEPILTSFKINYISKNGHFLHFYHQFHQFLIGISKIFFIFSESLVAQDHTDTNNAKIHPILTEKNIAPRK